MKPISPIKLVSTIVSISVWVLKSALCITFLAMKRKISVWNPDIRQYHYYYVDYPLTIWIPLILTIIAGAIVLFWRQLSIHSGKKTACGICTIFLCSVAGGILTLLIPDYDLWN